MLNYEFSILNTRENNLTFNIQNLALNEGIKWQHT